jgi:hypothetical protein
MPQVYGWEHLIYLTIVIGFMTIAFYTIRKYVKKELTLTILIKITGFLLLAAILWNRYSISYYRDGFNYFLPDSFCGMTSLVLSLSAIFCRKDHKIFHCTAYIGLFGGLLTLIYPDFIDQNESFFYPMTISGLIHHTLMVFLVLMMLMMGYVKLKLSNWPVLPLGMCLYMTYGIFLITVLDYKDAMYIYEPILPHTLLNWFVLGILFLVIYTIFLFIWDRKCVKK